MKAWFQRFMSGRYGMDQFGYFLNILSLILLVLGIFGPKILYWLGLAALIYGYYRFLSRDTHKRYKENLWYLSKRSVVSRWLSKYKLRFEQRNVYRYCRCPHCRQELRVPRGRGKISITCPKCGTQFIKKS